MLRPSSYLLALMSVICAPRSADAQSPNEQLWFEYMLNYPFANSFNLENTFTYSTLLNIEEKIAANKGTELMNDAVVAELSSKVDAIRNKIVSAE